MSRMIWFALLMIAFVIGVIGCQTTGTSNAVLSPADACWIQSAANVASEAFTLAGGSAEIGAIAADGLSIAAGKQCTWTGNNPPSPIVPGSAPVPAKV